MRKIKIVSDSSSDVLEMEGVAFDSAPMKISTAEREFIDDPYNVSICTTWINCTITTIYRSFAISITKR